MQRTTRRLALCIPGALAVSGLLASFAVAAVSVTTGPATSITSRAATLYGTINTDGQAVRWQFQYGLTKNYNKSTPVVEIPAGKGPVSVAWRITGLTPNTVYHYRLAVTTTGDTTYVPFEFAPGQDKTFKSGATGRLRLLSRKLPVHKGVISASLRCQSAFACRGKWSVTTFSGGATVDCTFAGRPSYRIRAHRRKVVRARVTGLCLSLLRASTNHQLGGKFSSRPKTGQSGVAKGVRLILR
jgi:hypothetical protein